MLVVGFSEYVTIQEQLAYQHFVASGGRLVSMSSDMFQVQVAYSAKTNTERLVLGHGFAFNGNTAWRSIDSPWEANNTNWFGSTKCCFHRFNYTGAVVNPNDPIGVRLQNSFGKVVFKTYASHEENAVRNWTATSIVATFQNQAGTLVAAYVHKYGSGYVISFGAFGEDSIPSDKSVQYFLVLGIGLDLRAVALQSPAVSAGANISIPPVIVTGEQPRSLAICPRNQASLK